MKIGIVVPHMFMQRDVLPCVIFSPARLALSLCDGLHAMGEDVTLFAPGDVDTSVRVITADLSLFEHELSVRGYDYLELLKKHPLTFVTMARQMQSEIVAKAFALANAGELDIVHIYTNEEDIALPFSSLCTKPVVFTHHDPFNFLIGYKNIFPKYASRNWISFSYAQRSGMPADTRWIANIYHGLDPQRFTPLQSPAGNYFAYLGRIIEAKGVHLAIAAVKQYNRTHGTHIPLKIAGKHYTGHGKESYWDTAIAPQIDNIEIQYVGFLETDTETNEFLGNARALLVPSLFDEPFGMVMIESLACGTPIIGIGSGAIPEIITPEIGFCVAKDSNEETMITGLATSLAAIANIDRTACRTAFESRFSVERMCREYLLAYRSLTK